MSISASSARSEVDAPKAKVAVVTGASSGIGRAIAKSLVRAGFKVLGTCRNPVKLPREQLQEFGFVPMHVDRDDSVTSAFRTIFETVDSIDLLICAAGMGMAGSVEETSLEEARAQLETNFFGTLRTIKAVLPRFRENRKGRIFVISSLAGQVGIPFQSLYSASKFALEGFVEGLRLELVPFGVQVALIEPGDFKTGFAAARRIASSYIKSGPASPYQKTHEAALGQMVHDEEHGMDPEAVAQLVLRLTEARRLRVRYAVGPIAQRLGVQLKRFLPSSLYERLIGLSYHSY